MMYGKISMIYLASPYSGTLEQMQDRFERTGKVVAKLLTAEMFVYSPIVHCHEIAQKYSMPKTFDFWAAYNLHMLSLAEKLYVLKLPDWDISKGVNAEIDFALEKCIPIVFIDE